MNMNTGCNYIHIDNNDSNEEEEAQMDDEEEGEEDEDEPDFMDNSGKCWEFGSKIVDEKHLKEWCQNKMGGMIVGKEEKLTRQFHCQIKQCQFKAIFLKSCSTIYTRNKHNHGMENARNSQKKKEEEKSNPRSQSTLEADYVDRLGKTWIFHANIGKNISADKLLNKFGFSSIRNTVATLNFNCQKFNPNGEKCKFAGIYLKSNGYLYTRGKHEHMKKEKMPPNIGDDYLDHLGNIWKFSKEIGKNVKREIFHNKFGLVRFASRASGSYLRCTRKGTNGKCKFAGIYLNSNGCLYTRGKHNHPHIEKDPKPNVGDDYVDSHSKRWPFHSKIGKNIPKGILLNKFGFSTIYQKQRTMNLYCKKKGINGEICPFSGIYLKSNGCLYTRGKHEHKYE